MVGAIIVFWLGATFWLGYREIWVKFVTDSPPELTIDLADEATTVPLPVRWILIRNDKEIGRVETRMVYAPAEDTFELHSNMKQVELVYPIFQPLTLKTTVPKFETMQRVTRGGELREVAGKGEITCAVMSGPLTLYSFNLNTDLRGIVKQDRIHWTVKLGDVSATIDPTPVPTGSVLNPLQPLNRIRGLRPGQRWELTLVDPLADAITAGLPQLLAKMSNEVGVAPQEGIALPKIGGPRVLRAEVLRELREFDKKPYRIIEYHSGEELMGRTWIDEETGKVVRQEAFQMGEHLILQREDLVSRAVTP